ncbi:uncharacterized protein [Dysidea avara]|uniref:uncharacterized protein isoform X1 n=1 Tax=Dysidea avara TaxID=196820 RepID=UPI0033236CE9
MLSLLKRHFEKFQSSHSHNQNDKDTIPRTNSQGRSWRKLNVLLPAHLKSKGKRNKVKQQKTCYFWKSLRQYLKETAIIMLTLLQDPLIQCVDMEDTIDYIKNEIPVKVMDNVQDIVEAVLTRDINAR